MPVFAPVLLFALVFVLGRFVVARAQALRLRASWSDRQSPSSWSTRRVSSLKCASWLLVSVFPVVFVVFVVDSRALGSAAPVRSTSGHHPQ